MDRKEDRVSHLTSPFGDVGDSVGWACACALRQFKQSVISRL